MHVACLAKRLAGRRRVAVEARQRAAVEAGPRCEDPVAHQAINDEAGRTWVLAALCRAGIAAMRRKPSTLPGQIDTCVRATHHAGRALLGETKPKAVEPEARLVPVAVGRTHPHRSHPGIRTVLVGAAEPFLDTDRSQVGIRTVP